MMIAFTHLRRLGLAVPLAAGLAISPALAQSPDSTSSQQMQEDRAVVQDSVQDEASRQLDEKRKALLADAAAALAETEKALEALDGDDSWKALESLALATGKLELIVARDPELALAPVGSISSAATSSAIWKPLREPARSSRT